MYFFATRAEAEQARKDAAAASPPVAAGAVVAAVPFSAALSLFFRPPFKIPGLPGYCAWRFHPAPSSTAEALRLSGLDRLSDLAIPVFYDSGTSDKQRLDLFFSPEALGRTSGTIIAADLGRLAKTRAEAQAKGLNSTGPDIRLPQAKKLPKSKQGDFFDSKCVLAIEWNID